MDQSTISTGKSPFLVGKSTISMGKSPCYSWVNPLNFDWAMASSSQTVHVDQRLTRAPRLCGIGWTHGAAAPGGCIVNEKERSQKKRKDPI